MAQTTSPPFPRDDDALAGLHLEVAEALEDGLRQLGEVLERTFGREPTQAALRVLLVDASQHGAWRGKLRVECDRLGWRAYLDQNSRYIDSVDLTQTWREGAEYAGQGIAPGKRHGQPSSLKNREHRVRTLVAHGAAMLAHGAMLFGDAHQDIWKGVSARAAIDFGGTVALDGLQLLSGVSLGAVRNAVSLGELRPDEAGNIPAEQAKAWLMRRREFCPSRWTNPDDDQEPFAMKRVTEADGNGTILVPQDGEGTPFTPEHVVRTAKSGRGLSITTGAKGLEEQHRDFYRALTALAKMDVARWRRRNAAGNWGIVRARGPWIAVSQAEIDRQLAAKRAEMT